MDDERALFLVKCFPDDFVRTPKRRWNPVEKRSVRLTEVKSTMSSRHFKAYVVDQIKKK